MTLSYQQPGLTLRRSGTGASDQQVRDLQRHLRCLGYLRRGIDGDFGGGTELAVKGLQHDLLHNDSAGRDGRDAPVAITGYNTGGRVTNVTGEVDQQLAACIADMMTDDGFPKIPFSDDPVGENLQVVEALMSLPQDKAPGPFLLAILKRESGLKHYLEPTGGNEDSYIQVGLDRNLEGQSHAVTSRGYGAGQFTLFHHPPHQDEVDDFMVDVRRNVITAADELREKFDRFVNGATSGTQADDRLAEIGTGALRHCRFDAGDPKRMRDCKACALAAGQQNLETGDVAWHAETTRAYGPSQYYDYGRLDFTAIPVRANFECDWPYAARRYNGSGPNSYNYQALILKNLLDTPD